MDKEANALNIAEAAESRSMAAKEMAQSERHRASSQMQAVKAWLETNVALLHDELDRIASHCHHGSTEWIMKTPKMKAWIQNTSVQSILWLMGKPGAGKSVICSTLIQALQHRRLN